MRNKIVVIGGGIAGLTTARELVKAGYQVVLLEAESELGAKSSSKNHGWLHESGRYYLLIHGLEIVRQCQEGARQILSIAPQCLEPWQGTFFLTQDVDLADRYARSCRGAGLSPDEVSVKSVCKHEPALRGSSIRAAFRASDRPFRPAVVLHRLRQVLEEAGVDIRCNFRVERLRFQGDRILAIECNHAGTRQEIGANFFVNATGAWSRKLLQAAGLRNCGELRVFKSSLLVVEQLLNAETMLVSLDSQGPTIVPHGPRTVLGVNHDSEEVQHDVDVARGEQHRIETILSAVGQLMPGLKERAASSAAYAWSCLKPEFIHRGSGRARSPAYAVIPHDQVSNLITSLPGKFTVAPVMAKAVLKTIQERFPIRSTVQGKVVIGSPKMEASHGRN